MKKFKGFTLVELIIVMAIMSILMVGIMSMFRPIRSVYLDSTLYESQRTTQNGMVQYITESIRYATNIGLDNKSIAPEDAVRKFCKKLEWTNGQVRDIELLIVDNVSGDEYNSYHYYGRLYRGTARVTATVDALNNATFSIKDVNGNLLIKERLALGTAYYGPHTYSISLTHEPVNTGTNTPSKETLKVTAASLLTNNLAKQKNAQTDTIGTLGEFVLTEGEVSLKNVSSKVQSPGIYDVENYNGNSTTMNTINYILYTTDK